MPSDHIHHALFDGSFFTDALEGQMDVRLALKAASVLSLGVVGIPGNLAALLLFCHLFVKQQHIHHNEVILSQLVFANLSVTLCRSIPQALTVLGIDVFYDDHSCRLIILTYRVARGMSVTLTSLLSAYQCVVIAPSQHGWIWLKNWLPVHLPHVTIFLYGLNLAIHTSTIVYAEAFSINSSTQEYSLNLKTCIIVLPGHTFYVFTGMISILRDFIFVGLMAAAAGYVMLLLHRHRQQVQGLQGAGRKTEEASRAVLLLVSTYVVLFSLENVVRFSSLFVSREHPAVTDARVFFATCYSTISPVLIIATNKKLVKYFECGSKVNAAQNIQSDVEFKVSSVTITQ